MTVRTAEAPLVSLPLSVTPDELARYVMALANTHGGQVVVGQPDEDASDLHPLQVTHAIFELSGGRLTVNVMHQPPDGDGPRQLYVYVPQAPYLLAAPDGSVLSWDGQQLVPVTPAQAQPQAQQDYTATVPPTASLADLDPLEVARLRSTSQKGDLSALPDLDFLRELGLLVEERGEWRPNLACILLAGTPRALRSHLPQAEVCYYHHPTLDPEFSFREDLRRPLVSAVSRLAELIQARNRFTPVQVGLFRIEVWDYDEAVYREALLNALTHRDYQLRDVVHVHQHPDRLEISNPGGLPGGITPGNILRHQPKRRNPLLAEVLSRLGLVERAGVGVDKMYQLMLRHGKEPPEFTSYSDAVSLSLHNPGFDQQFVRFVARKQEEMQTLSLDMLIVLSRLGREGEATREQLSRALQLPEDRTPRLLQMMQDRGLLESSGRGRERLYHLSAEVRAQLHQRSEAVTGVSTVTRPQRAAVPPTVPVPSALGQLALALAQQHGQVSNARLREASGLNVQQAWRVLRRLVLNGQLIKQGSGPRNVQYHLS
ncbi:ATP-binding protein [Deinococcus sonorensis]|uniref:ATP-binding protein n=2 Tax=Deinococcus sonorensis TaxID=309891 RepID=A0AAU7U8J5_9DEIO